MEPVLNATEIWLAGKGPSLDSFDWSKAGPCRIGINEVAYIIPDCFGAIAIDYRVLDKYAGLHDHKKLPSNIVVFRKDCHVRYQFGQMYIWSKGKEVQHLYATAPIAIQLFSYLGVKKIHFIGFDSIKGLAGYAKSIQTLRAEGLNRDNYQRINEQIIKVIEQTRVEAIWEC